MHSDCYAFIMVALEQHLTTLLLTLLAAEWKLFQTFYWNLEMKDILIKFNLKIFIKMQHD